MPVVRGELDSLVEAIKTSRVSLLDAQHYVMTGHLQEAETIVARLGNDLLNLRHAIYQEANRAQ